MSSFSNKVNGLTLAVGWFNKYIGTGMGVFAIGLGISTSKWNNAAAAGKKLSKTIALSGIGMDTQLVP